MTGIIEEKLKDFIASEFSLNIHPVFVVADEAHGDFATNVAMQLSSQVGISPRDIAEKLVTKVQSFDNVAEASVAGPGFLNIRLKDTEIISSLKNIKSATEPQATVLLEYSCPNAFKELHTGHLYQTLIGDSMGRIYEKQGYNVVRTSFGGDVGLHAAKCMWGILDALEGENPDKLNDIENRASWISDAYVKGSSEYEKNESVKSEITRLNKKIYELFSSKDTDSNFAKIYFTCRQWSYDYFDNFYESILAKPFDKYYPESSTMDVGVKIVKENIGKIFSESQSAIILDEARSGLHTRVFLTSEGLPTYEAKDLGVIYLEKSDFPYDKRVIMTGNDQSEYMKVVFKAVELIEKDLAIKQKHVANGTVRFGDGKKMSSRLGNVSKAVDVIDVVEQAVEATSEQLKKQIALGAVKYSMLKSRVGSDISFDIDQSVSLEGNSGPYLQYALVRAKSIIRKANSVDIKIDEFDTLDKYERRLAFKLTRFNDVLDEAINDFSPHHICTYLYDLAVSFNQFYEKSRVIDDPRSSIRIFLVKNYQEILGQGLELLGVPTPDEM